MSSHMSTEGNTSLSSTAGFVHPNNYTLLYYAMFIDTGNNHFTIASIKYILFKKQQQRILEKMGDGNALEYHAWMHGWRNGQLLNYYSKPAPPCSFSGCQGDSGLVYL